MSSKSNLVKQWIPLVEREYVLTCWKGQEVVAPFQRKGGSCCFGETLGIIFTLKQIQLEGLTSGISIRWYCFIYT